ncbi:MAG: 2-oxoacid:acceptor oxidoreductase family protein [Heliobacteriaceae bacterium]|nr:2-oxoacid:acceptor oxidoreductase family protein [Heliobacteriaceae bacterium]MDD4587566.1 2-oxoacid:acceptor oxidoreductase family protein [Heliobacteriaceae bacterium]
MIHELLLAGFGGQGMLTVGIALAYAGMMEGRQVAYVPSYGAEMRGGTANCMVTIADREISSPVVASPALAVVMNRPSLDKFESRIKPGGALLVNTSLVERTVFRSDLRVYQIPTLELATEGGMARAANMAMLGALIGVCGVVDLGTVPAALEKAFKGKYRDKLAANMAVVRKGIEYVCNVQKESAAKRRATA